MVIYPVIGQAIVVILLVIHAASSSENGPLQDHLKTIMVNTALVKPVYSVEDCGVILTLLRHCAQEARQ